ncbi:MAG TPA: DUF559 domain-containing protein [Lichenihabitans sp.]|jgi:very-short-patch-repair endonuclease|nr:DUF559 domain-containing protein [Lichenihabitans sp.]
MPPPTGLPAHPQWKARLAVDLNGGQHTFEDQMAHDRRCDGWLAYAGFMTLRFWNPGVEKNLEGVVETILFHARRRLETELGASLPHPSACA